MLRSRCVLWSLLAAHLLSAFPTRSAIPLFFLLSVHFLSIPKPHPHTLSSYLGPSTPRAPLAAALVRGQPAASPPQYAAALTNGMRRVRVKQLNKFCLFLHVGLRL